MTSENPVTASEANAPRILVAGLFHETHTFLDGTTALKDFTIHRDAELLALKGDASPMGGVLEKAEEFGWEVVPGVDYRAQPSALVEDEVIETFWEDLSKRITDAQANSGALDGLYLVLHGAMVSQSLDDVEGEMLERLRLLPGLAELPVFGVYDLHANFTARMASHADCLVGYTENPHIDARDAAEDAACLLQRCLKTGERPRLYWAHPPVMWPPTGTGTAEDPMKALETLAREMERSVPHVWSVSVNAGFSFADTPDTGVSFAIASTGGVDLVLPLLDQLTAEALRRKEEGCRVDPPITDLMPLLTSPEPGLTVLVEAADNIGGGAPGDATGVMRALIHWQVPNCAVCIADAEAVAGLKGIGKGQRAMVAMGGKGSKLDAGPVQVEVEVISHSDGKFELEDKQSHLASMCGDSFDMGPSVVVRHKELTVLLTSVKTPPFDLGQWRSQGLEPTDFSVMVVKAAVAHRRAYDAIATRMLWVDSDGPCRSRLEALPFEKVRRPIYPLDALG